MGKDQVTNRSRGGSMHIAVPKLGIFGATPGPSRAAGTTRRRLGLTRGLRDRFGDRVCDTPISETAIMGSAWERRWPGCGQWSS